MRGECMEYTKSALVDLIKKTVYEVTNVKVEDEKMNLLDNRLNIRPADFLYIFDLLEKKLHVPAADILRDHDHTIMEVGAMGDALLKLL